MLLQFSRFLRRKPKELTVALDPLTAFIDAWEQVKVRWITLARFGASCLIPYAFVPPRSCSSFPMVRSRSLLSARLS